MAESRSRAHHAPREHRRMQHDHASHMPLHVRTAAPPIVDVPEQYRNSKRSPEQRSTFLRFYFLLVMLYGLLGFLHNLLIRNDPHLSKYAVFTQTVGMLSFAFVFFSVAALVFFWQYHFAPLVFILPWYYIIFQTLLIIVNYLPLLRNLVGLSFQAGPVHMVFTIVGITTSLFEFFFAFYVIERLRLFG